jgi:hypothetical protein
MKDTVYKIISLFLNPITDYLFKKKHFLITFLQKRKIIRLKITNNKILTELFKKDYH